MNRQTPSPVRNGALHLESVHDARQWPPGRLGDAILAREAHGLTVYRLGRVRVSRLGPDHRCPCPIHLGADRGSFTY